MNTTDRELEILEDTVLTLEEEKKGMVQYALQLQQEIVSRENQKQFTLEVLEKTKKSETQLQIDFKKMLDYAIKQTKQIRELKEQLKQSKI